MNKKSSVLVLAGKPEHVHIVWMMLDVAVFCVCVIGYHINIYIWIEPQGLSSLSIFRLPIPYYINTVWAYHLIPV